MVSEESQGAEPIAAEKKRRAEVKVTEREVLLMGMKDKMRGQGVV
jgi:hypothetical protein